MIKVDARVINCKSPINGRIVQIIFDFHSCMFTAAEAVIKWHDCSISTIKADRLVDRVEFLELVP